VYGNWRLIIDSPMGKQDFSIDLTGGDGQLNGTLVNNNTKMTTDIFDGVVEGDQLEWKAKLKQIPMTLAFTTKVEDDTMSGSVKAGMFGNFQLTGQRG
jgi:hypothetical protein